MFCGCFDTPVECGSWEVVRESLLVDDGCGSAVVAIDGPDTERSLSPFEEVIVLVLGLP